MCECLKSMLLHVYLLFLPWPTYTRSPNYQSICTNIEKNMCALFLPLIHIFSLQLFLLLSNTFCLWIIFQAVIVHLPSLHCFLNTTVLAIKYILIQYKTRYAPYEFCNPCPRMCIVYLYHFYCLRSGKIICI